MGGREYAGRRAPQWAAAYFRSTSAGIRPRSLTTRPCSLAQSRTLALCWRVLAVRRPPPPPKPA